MGESTTVDWWHDAVGYEVYIRSFADSNGDGLGDLAGITAKLPHLADLGVDIVWITPFYRSPGADHGYDVSDYQGIDPDFGDDQDLDTLISAAHDLGLRVVVDLVPNHCSSQHPWFLDALGGPDAPCRDHFVWRNPAPDGGPPNNWVSYFGGPAWTLDEASGQYYLHLFLPEQPDLNWDNEAVRAAFDDILEHWLERGVDGFRIDVAHALVKNPHLTDNPQLRPTAAGMTATEAFLCFDHRHDLDQDGVKDVYRRWKAITDRHGAVLIGEVYLADAARVASFLGTGGLDLSFWFAPMHSLWEPTAIQRVFQEATDARTDGWAWVQCSHDEVRSVTRFGGGDRGAERARALTMLLLGLPGSPFIYQGEELGLTEGAVPPELQADPRAVRNEGDEPTRDGCRTPMPWAPGPQFGFTTADRAWLPDGGRTDADTAAAQSADPSSPLSWFRRALRLRRETADIRTGTVAWLSEAESPELVLRHGDLLVILNASESGVEVALPEGRWSLVLDSSLGPDPTGGLEMGPVVESTLTVPADRAVWLRPAMS